MVLSHLAYRRHVRPRPGVLLRGVGAPPLERSSMRGFVLFVGLLGALLLPAPQPRAGTNAPPLQGPGATTVILVIGTPGEAEFVDAFSQQAVIWKELCHRAGCDLTTVGLSNLTITPSSA